MGFSRALFVFLLRPIRPWLFLAIGTLSSGAMGLGLSIGAKEVLSERMGSQPCVVCGPDPTHPRVAAGLQYEWNAGFFCTSDISVPGTEATSTARNAAR